MSRFIHKIFDEKAIELWPYVSLTAPSVFFLAMGIAQIFIFMIYFDYLTEWIVHANNKLHDVEYVPTEKEQDFSYAGSLIGLFVFAPTHCAMGMLAYKVSGSFTEQAIGKTAIDRVKAAISDEEDDNIELESQVGKQKKKEGFEDITIENDAILNKIDEDDDEDNLTEAERSRFHSVDVWFLNKILWCWPSVWLWTFKLCLDKKNRWPWWFLSIPLMLVLFSYLLVGIEKENIIYRTTKEIEKLKKQAPMI